MNNILTAGRARGVFEIFVPGVFLLLNISVALYLFPVNRGILELASSEWLSSPVIVTIFTISFGYLFGIVLRVLRANYADRASVFFLKKYKWKPGRKNGDYPIYLVEDFPFIESLKERAYADYPLEASSFFDEVWYKKRSGVQGQAFFNFCKLMVGSEDQWLANEIYSAEALTRYMASIFYALTLSFISLTAVEAIRWVYVGSVEEILILVLLAYLMAIAVILRNFRFVRLKEVETVFAATFKNRDILFASRVHEAQKSIRPVTSPGSVSDANQSARMLE